MHETISEPFVVPRFLNTTLRRRREYINSSHYNGQEVSNRLERNCLNRLQMGKFECFRYRAGTLHLFICLTLLLSRYICRRCSCGDASDRFYTSPGSASALCPNQNNQARLQLQKSETRNHLVLIKSVQAIRLLRLDSSATASSFVVVFAMATDYEW